MKAIKLILTSVLALAVTSTTAFAYNFPQPDWGALLSQREAMVTENELELYAESDPSSAPYYGARLEPGSGTYIGIDANKDTSSYKPLGSYLTYIDSVYQTDFYYPANDMISNDNVMTMAGWNFSSLDEVNYDTIRTTLNNLEKYNKPIYIRFAAEMNCSELGDEPDRYIEIFRNVANMVHEYPNFAVVWSPNDIGALDRPFEYYYPGDEYVDWIGVSCYMIQYFQGDTNTQYKDSVYFMTGAYSWATNRIKPVMEFLQKYNINKPVMISEGGVSTHNSYGDDCQAWATPRLRNMLWYLPMKYPQIKLINYFNVVRDEIEKFDISPYQYASDIFNEAAANGAYIREAGGRPSFVFQPAYWAGTLNATDNAVRLYTLAYVADQPNLSVSYSIDGVWQHSSDQIPYIYYMDMNTVADGTHTLKISTYGMEKNYNFIKSGNSILFGENLSADDLPAADTTTPSEEINVNVNGNIISFDQSPIIQDGRTLVPVRAIFESLNASVDWNVDTQSVTSVRGNDTVYLTVGSDVMIKNSSEIKLEVAAQIINGRTLVPARAVAEAFGANVEWDESTKTVLINTQ